MSSRDGLHWDRRFLEAFIRPGRDPRNWLNRNNYPVPGLVATASDELSLYVIRNYKFPSVHIERMVLRTDGFTSVHAGYAGGASPFRDERRRFVLAAIPITGSPGRRSQVAGRRSQVAGRRSQVAGRRSQVAGRRSQVAGRRSQVAGRRSQVAGRRSQVAGRRSIGSTASFPQESRACIAPSGGSQICLKPEGALRLQKRGT